MHKTDMYEGMIAETTTLRGYSGDLINAYFARPIGEKEVPGIVLIHHLPGWDEWYREATRRLAHHGFASICPNLYHRSGHGTAEDVATKVRAEGGISDDQVLGDVSGAISYLRSLPQISDKIGVIGTCSGGRNTYLAACRLGGIDAAVDCWGGRVVVTPDELTPKQPVAPVDYTKDLACPLLGLFGEEDKNPSPQQVSEHENELRKYKKDYEFHMYPKAGHGFFYYDKPIYRQEQAMDGWQKIYEFFEKHLG